MPEVFANTTPLQYLHRLGRLDWLRDFYGRVVIPEAVAAELDAGRRLGAKVPEVPGVPWIEVRELPVPLEPSDVFPAFIHRGEAGVMALARLSDDALILMDDGLARAHAPVLGLRITGTLGVILRAKREGRISALAPLLKQLQDEGFRIAVATRAEVLRLAGE
jgi:predicted nucleic acid-binding protein